MRIENGYLQQSMLCSKNNRNAVGNFSDTMNKAQECISNKISTRDSYVNSTDYSNFGIYTQNSISQDIELPIDTTILPASDVFPQSSDGCLTSCNPSPR